MSIPVVVLSCDKYDFVWKAWEACWRNNFPAGLGPYYLVTGTKDPKIKGVNTILTGTDDWGQSLIAAMDQINHYYFLLSLDDFLFESNANDVPWGIIEKYFSWGTHEVPKFSCLGIHADSPYYAAKITDWAIGKNKLKQLPLHAPYHASLQPTVWKAPLLRSILSISGARNGGLNPWRFEGVGSDAMRTIEHPRTFIDLPWYVHAIKRGKWLPEGIAMTKKHGVNL